MPTEITSESRDGVMLVGASDGSGDYILWQKSDDLGERSGIHFEWDDQSNGGCELVCECSVDRDGVHVTLADSRLVHFYFHQLAKEDWDSFMVGLETMYVGHSELLAFHY